MIIPGSLTCHGLIAPPLLYAPWGIKSSFYWRRWIRHIILKLRGNTNILITPRVITLPKIHSNSSTFGSYFDPMWQYLNVWCKACQTFEVRENSYIARSRIQSTHATHHQLFAMHGLYRYDSCILFLFYFIMFISRCIQDFNDAIL